MADIWRGSSGVSSSLRQHCYSHIWPAHLLKIIASQAGALGIQIGELVTTGSVTKAYGIHLGEVWSTIVNGIDLPGLTVEFVSGATI